jgi:hypothetical protein
LDIKGIVLRGRTLPLIGADERGLKPNTETQRHGENPRKKIPFDLSGLSLSFTSASSVPLRFKGFAFDLCFLAGLR